MLAEKERESERESESVERRGEVWMLLLLPIRFGT